MPVAMKQLSLLLVASTLALSACKDYAFNQWIDPDKSFADMPSPDVKGVADTQEEAAKAAAANGDFARAGQFYQQLLGSDKNTDAQKLRFKLGWAEAERRQGNFDKSLAMYSQLVRENPDNIDAKEGEALSLAATGKTVDAGREFSEVIAKDPTRWRTLNALGILFTSKNMIPEAMAYYNEALKYSPDNPAVLNNVGLSQAVDHKYAESIAALDQASRKSKSPAQRRQIDLNLAMVYGASGDSDTAKDIASKYLDGAALDNNLGLYAHLAKDDTLAKAYINMALSQSPTYYERGWNNLDVVGGGSGADVKP